MFIYPVLEKTSIPSMEQHLTNSYLECAGHVARMGIVAKAARSSLLRFKDTLKRNMTKYNIDQKTSYYKAAHNRPTWRAMGSGHVNVIDESTDSY